MNIFKGLSTALITPFTKNDEIDINFLKILVNNQISKGIDYLVILGTTAETPSLTYTEKKLIIHTVVEEVRGRIPVVLGLGSNSTQHLLDDLQDFDLTSISGLLSVTPYYNRPTQEGIYRHFAALAHATSLPIMLYNVPKRCGENIAPETIVRLANDFENIKAVKEASASIAQCQRIMAEKPDNFAVISGDDSMALPFVALGSEGLVSVVSNAYPALVGQMFRCSMGNEYPKAREVFYALKPIITNVFAEGNPVGIKYYMSRLWERAELANVRLPLVPISEELKRTIAL
ncbi:MAG: 4-hydroxy-tetrahydrodipicolinate synthase [Bacteroidales bacterium]|jgi:4-hydroxy-tetrahydrodipicolinate synthase|nr:4-hydroxy-tetrahydrodipicolinate synthase [Bacteroidales bacterium]